MMAANTTVVGVFEDRTQAASAIEELRHTGFSDNQIGFAARQETGYTETATEGTTGEGPGGILRGIVGGVLGVADALLLPITGPADASTILSTVLPVAEEAIDRLPYPGSKQDTVQHPRPDAPMTVKETPSSTPETASTENVRSEETSSEKGGREGIITGGIIGGVLGAAAAFLIPGIGPAIAGGILATTFGGAAIGGMAGGFLGVFTHLGVPEEKARYYEQEFKAGRTLVTVHAENRAQKAIEILRSHGAQDVQEH